MLKQAAVLEISAHCWIFRIRVLKSSGRLLNIREQTTVLTSVCFARNSLAVCHFLKKEWSFEFPSVFFFLLSWPDKQTRGHCLHFIDSLLKDKLEGYFWLFSLSFQSSLRVRREKFQAFKANCKILPHSFTLYLDTTSKPYLI